MGSTPQITVAARIDRLPLFSLHRKLALILGIGTFFDLYDIFLGSVLVATLTKPYQLDTLSQALLLSASFIGMFFGAMILGIISDYVGRRTMFLVTLLIYSFFSFVAAFSPSFIWIVIFRFLAGLGLGSEPPLTDIYMGEMIPKKARGRYTAWSYTLGFLGVPLVGLAGRFFATTPFLGLDGWRWLLILGSAGALIVWSLRHDLPESPRWFEIRNQSSIANAALNVIERSARQEHGLQELPQPEEIRVESQTRVPISEIFNSAYAERTTMLWIFQILQTVGYYGFGMLAPIVLRTKGFTITSTLLYTGLIFLGYPLGSLLSVFLVERFERKWLIVGSAILIGLFGLIFGFASTVPLILVPGFLLTTVSNVFANAFHIYQAEIFPTRMRGTAVGIAYSLSRLTSAVLPFIALPILQAYGPVAVFAGSATIMAILCLDVGLFGPKSTGQSLETVSQ